MSEQIRRTTDGAILYDDALLSHAGEEHFDPRYWQASGAVTSAVGGRGDALVVVVPGGGEWVLRHYRRGGLPARVSRDFYLWFGSERSRPWREWRLLASLYEEGLPVPQPVAARVVRVGVGYRGDLLTRRIPAARSLAESLRAGNTVPWQDIGRTLRRFHDANVCHADLNAHNVMLDEDGRVWLLDFDRGTRRRDGSWKQANLRRLQRSLRKLGLGREAEWQSLLDGYRG